MSAALIAALFFTVILLVITAYFLMGSVPLARICSRIASMRGMTCWRSRMASSVRTPAPAANTNLPAKA